MHMTLNGLAIALYQRKDGSHVVSSTALASTSERDIYIENSEQREVNPFAEQTNARASMEKIVESVNSYRAQIAEIGDQDMLVPLPIVFGVSESHPVDAYSRMIRTAFPEYFSGNEKPNNSSSVNTLLGHLFREHHRRKVGPPDSDEPQSHVALHDFQLFLPDDSQYTKGYAVTQRDQLAGIALENLMSRANTGDTHARDALVGCAIYDADEYAKDLDRRKILDPVRFIQFGIHTDAYKNARRYTYLEWSNLKDIFVQRIISQLKEQHNVCLKTPNDEASPAFADIAATYLADTWMFIHHLRTQQVLEFKNVFAKRRPVT